MDKETLSNYGWIVICTLVLAVMIALSTPFSNFVADAIKSTISGLINVNDEVLEIIDTPDPALNPENADTFGIYFLHGDYMYKRGVVSGNKYGAQTLDEAWDVLTQLLAFDNMTWQDMVEREKPEGFTEEEFKAYLGMTEETFEPTVFDDYYGVRVSDKTKTEYTPLLESINGVPVINLDGTFQDCANMVHAPVLPRNATSMVQTFNNCYALVEAPKIPNGVTNMFGAFNNCYSLVTAPILPSNVTNVYGMFSGCTALSTYAGSMDVNGDFSDYKLPSEITDMTGMFSKCSNITVAPKIPNKVINMSMTFSDCLSLKTAPTIPSSVKFMGTTFAGCTSLTSAPVIPENVVNLYQTFKNCTALTGTITINTQSITQLWDGNGAGDSAEYKNVCIMCFDNVDMSKITLTGTAPQETLDILRSTGNN